MSVPALNRYQRGNSDGGMLILVIILLFFLFWGEPDVWDVLHAKVMSLHPVGEQKQEAPQPKPAPKKGLAF